MLLQIAACKITYFCLGTIIFGTVIRIGGLSGPNSIGCALYA